MQAYAAGSGWKGVAASAVLGGGMGALNPLAGITGLAGTLAGGAAEADAGGEFFGKGMQIGGVAGGTLGGGLSAAARGGIRAAFTKAGMRRMGKALKMYFGCMYFGDVSA